MGYDMLKCGRKIKEFRLLNGMTQEQMADKLGISRVHLTLIEVGKKGWSIDLLIHFSEVFGVSIDELLLTRQRDWRHKMKIRRNLHNAIQLLEELEGSI